MSTMPQTLENINPASSQRRTDDDSLSLTGPSPSSRRVDDAPLPPRTPTKQLSSSRTGKASTADASRALRMKTPTRDTHLEDITPANDRETPDGGRNVRDSHGLSIPPRQMFRDSLVDHMLLSFDQFSIGQSTTDFGAGEQVTADEAQLYEAFEDEDPYAGYNISRGAARPGHQYSYSSDYESTVRSNHSRTSSLAAGRGRRSGSVSTYRPGRNRGNSLRDDVDDIAEGPLLRSAPAQARALHSRGSKGSKGSSGNSFDLGYAKVGGTHRFSPRANIAPSSSDYDPPKQTPKPQTVTSPVKVADHFSSSAYDAAPPPIVPGGSRKPTHLPTESPYFNDVAATPKIPRSPEQIRSNKSTKATYNSKVENINALGINFGADDANREFPPLPAFMKESAPAPSVGYNKSKEQPSQPPPAQEIEQTRERPGFFRRVFGGSKTNLAPTTTVERSLGSIASPETAGSRQSAKPEHVANQMMQTFQGKDLPPIPKEAPQLLTKKTSSFFRRRKKSISEAPPAPPLPAIPPSQMRPDRVDLKNTMEAPSPVSSLRKVMNPYLASPRKLDAHMSLERSRFDHSPDVGEDVRSFSPNYSPDKNATIRTVKTDARDEPPDSLWQAERISNDLDSPGYHTAKDDISVEENGPSNLENENEIDRPDSALSSQSALRSRAAAIKGDRAKLVSSPIPTAADVARDMALVAEYNRKHAKRSPNPNKEASSTTNGSHTSPYNSPNPQIHETTPNGDSEWVVFSPTKTDSAAAAANRVYLEATSSEEDLTSHVDLGMTTSSNKLSVRTSADTSANTSANTVYKSASSLPIVQVDGRRAQEQNSPLLTAAEALEMLDESEDMEKDAEPSAAEHDQAKKIYDGNEDVVPKSKAAAWLGEQNPTRQRTLKAYMSFFDFASLNILAALRLLCGRLILKAESQQVDRILDAFATRWCKCNPHHGFKVTDVVHTICYSILLLNTDLHLADIDSKMTRSQFVKNTMPTILRIVVDEEPTALERPSILPGRSHTLYDTPVSPIRAEIEAGAHRVSTDIEKPSWRSSIKPARRTDEGAVGPTPTPLNYTTPLDDCGPLVRAPFHGTLRTWEVQIEIVLKDFFNSIRAERLPLFGAAPEAPAPPMHSSNSLSVFTNLRRAPSVISKAPSESPTVRSRAGGDAMRLNTGKWGNKGRSRRIYATSTMASSRTSLDDQSSVWSPSQASSTWSKPSFGNPPSSMSTDSYSNWPKAELQQSIGFASALSQAIIREETVGSAGSVTADSDGDEFTRVAPLLEDESLGLYGAPWAKEGIVKHKFHLESTDKKSKDRNWNEVFAVVEKGYLSLFSFSSKTMRNKQKERGAQRVVGGGNWQDNAQNLGSFLLRQTIASVLPPPGYSKSRPHVWALSLPTGAVHLFQVGTPEIVAEFVSTANYWSARLSHHPLIGGISNIEFGWSDTIINNSLVLAINERTGSSGTLPTSTSTNNIARPGTGRSSISMTHTRRGSVPSTIRASFDHGPIAGLRKMLPGDKVNISDWNPPSQSMRSSTLMEQDQLRTLLDYVEGIEVELQKHNTLRSSMLIAFTPRSPNYNKAMSNWERKSSYLLKEIVKFTKYIDALQSAELAKREVYKERDERKLDLARERSKNFNLDTNDAAEGQMDPDATLKPK